MAKADKYWSIRKKALNGNVIVKLINRIKHRKLLEKNNASIPFATQIADEPVFPHGVAGIFISSKAKIGKKCTIFHQVTIGSNTLRDSKTKGAPIIGDNVYIGCGAKIIGGIRVGNNVRIGANCIVCQDIPDNCTVVLEKPKVIMHNYVKDNEYISYNYLKEELNEKQEDR